MLINVKQNLLCGSRAKIIALICAGVIIIGSITGIITAAVGNSKVRVCLDAGHGGSDVGAIGVNERYEKDDNLALTLAVRDELKKMGIKVLLTRKTDKSVSLEKRCAYANKKHADVFVSLHRNSAESASASGVEVWVLKDAPQADMRLAQAIMSNLEDAGISNSRGIKNGTAGTSGGDYYINSNTDMPSCLVEMGFISNDRDNSLFDSGTDLYAHAIAQAIADSLPFATN